MKCYPSKCFPLHCEKERPDPKKDFMAYKKWDDWYIWRYLLAPKMDEEEKYSIGSEWFEDWIHHSKTREKMIKKSKERPKRTFRTCWQYKWKECILMTLRK